MTDQEIRFALFKLIVRKDEPSIGVTAPIFDTEQVFNYIKTGEQPREDVQAH